MIENALSLSMWKRFVSEGVLDSARLSKRIAESWHRCKEAYVNPYLEKGKHILTSEILQSQKEKNALLLDIAAPYLNKVEKAAKELGMMALLIDAEGYVLSITGNSGVIEDARRINFVEGVQWTEQEIGTNAIGTALQAKEAIMVTGTEHYSVSSHRWCCAAAPMFHDDGSLIGILDLSCPIDRAHPYMLGMAISVAYSIERELSIRAHQDETELIQQSMDLLESDKDILVCSTKHAVAGASKSIRHMIPNWSNIKVKDVMDYGFYVQMEVPVFSQRTGKRIGKTMYLRRTPVKNAFLLSRASIPFSFKGESGISQSFQNTLNELRRVTPTDANVYISGETGTGKEVIARSIHENSLRKNGPFVAVNCGAIPKELIESELFGYAEGSFTGARRQGYKGKFEQANNGTLFLDEIGELPLSMQVALLRVLQERKVTPIGSTKDIPLNVRIVTATHKDLRSLVNNGQIREDLFYRLYVYPIHVPALRERKEDIPYLVRYFCEQHDWHVKLPPSFFHRLSQYNWPGNIRELFNFLERLRIFSQGEAPDAFDILQAMDAISLSQASTKQPSPQHETEVQALNAREIIQKEMMIEALRKTNGNVSLAAKMIGVPRSTFYKRLQRYNL
jgi:transcriptional regulator of acetoin/glycerol metabolism